MTTYMTSPGKQRALTAALIVACLVSLALFGRSSGARTVGGTVRPQDRVVEHVPVADQPVKIMGVAVGGRDFGLGEKIDRGEDWLRTLTVKVKNVSPKTITYVGLYLDFPDTKATGNVMAFPLRYGRNLRVPNSPAEPKWILPGATADIALSDGQYARLRNFLGRRHALADIRRAAVRLVDVDFSDGMIWDGGNLYRLDPNNPGKLVRAEESRNSHD